MDKKVSKHN